MYFPFVFCVATEVEKTDDITAAQEHKFDYSIILFLLVRYNHFIDNPLNLHCFIMFIYVMCVGGVSRNVYNLVSRKHSSMILGWLKVKRKSERNLYYIYNQVDNEGEFC